MKRAIVILEDDHERREAMLGWLTDRFPAYEQRCFEHPAALNAFLEARHDDVLALSLDHDLNELLGAAAEITGMKAVNALLTLEPSFPVIIHSSNGTAAAKMERRLKRAGWQ